MNFRKPLSVLAFVAIAAPLSALADAPSGEFYELYPRLGAGPAAASDRQDKDDRRAYAEFSIWDVIDESKAAGPGITREDVRRELALSPLPEVKA